MYRKALFFFVSLFIITTLGYSQANTAGLHVGTIPYSQFSIKTKATGTVQKGHYSITNPTIQAGFSFGELGFSRILELTYAKNVLLSNDSLGNVNSNIYRGHLYFNHVLNPYKRLQFHFNLGGGLSSYSEPKSLLLELGVKGRLLLFLSRHFALYGGGYYMHSVFSKKFSESDYGVEAGLAVYFDEMFTPKNTSKNMWLKKADETLNVTVFNEWDTPLSGAKVTLISGKNKTQDAPVCQGNSFTFQKLRPGPYTIIIEKNGFNTLRANLEVSNTRNNYGPSNKFSYILESTHGAPFKNVIQAINDATVERTEGDITYYLATVKKNNGRTYDKFKYEGDLEQIMDNVHFKLVKQNDQKGFLFRNLTEEKIKKEKNNSSLKLPAVLDIKGACAFYTQNLKNNTTLAKAYKSHVAKVLDIYLLWQKEIKWFCDKSPYEGDLLRGYDILSKMENKRDDYVYYVTADSGYIVNGEMTYAGGLSNKKMNGKGKVSKVTGIKNGFVVKENSYEGTFKNGIMNGTMYHKWVGKNYYALNGSFANTDHDVTIEERGTMVNDQWNGDVDYRARGFLGTYYNDHATKHYTNGVYISQWIFDDGLSRVLLGEKYRNQAEAEAERRKIAALTENEIMDYVASMEREEYSDDVYYYVYFKFINGMSSDSMKGTLKLSKFGDWEWDEGHQTDGLFSNFRKARPNTKNRALLELYWKLNYIN